MYLHEYMNKDVYVYACVWAIVLNIPDISYILVDISFYKACFGLPQSDMVAISFTTF